jgi:glycosyltransferase involved in cell wall biosynthesis
MTKATVMIPTHAHPATLPYSITSVLEQTMPDFELFIVGDGVGDDTRTALRPFLDKDSRIRFFDLPKGPRKGEIHRHEVLKEASGRFCAYLGDDDLWFPNHLETLNQTLKDADFGHTLHLDSRRKGEVVPFPADLSDPHFKARMLGEFFNRFDMTFAGHTLAAYRRLPIGWEAPPATFPWNDLYLWRKFLAAPWCRVRSTMVPTAIYFATNTRKRTSNQEHADELSYWAKRMKQPDFYAQLALDLVRQLALQGARFEARLHALEVAIERAKRQQRTGKLVSSGPPRSQ